MTAASNAHTGAAVQGKNSSVCVCSRPCSNILMADTSVSRLRQGLTLLLFHSVFLRLAREYSTVR